jgi:ethanolamine utilization protein EutA
VGETYDGETLAETLVQALEMAAGLRKADGLLEQLTTKGTFMAPPEGEVVISFSGGVADCIEKVLPKGAFSDLGPALGQAIKKSRLCQGQYLMGEHTIRATVIGAGCYSTQLSGSTVYHRNISFPVRNLAVVPVTAEDDWEQSLQRYDGDGVLYLTGVASASYQQLVCLAEKAAGVFQNRLAAVAMESDFAKALGQCIGLRLGQDRKILCLDGLKLKQGDYLDVGIPVGTAVPVIVRTLIFEGG